MSVVGPAPVRAPDSQTSPPGNHYAKRDTPNPPTKPGHLVERSERKGSFNTNVVQAFKNLQQSNPPVPMGTYAQFDTRPERPAFAMNDRNRRPSGSSIASTTGSRESLETRMRSPASSRTSFESMDLISKPEDSAGFPCPLPARSRKVQPGELFAVLPGEVFELILDALKELHLNPGSETCATCMMRDFCSIALSARKCLKYARVSLYEDIQLVGSDSDKLRKRYRINFGSRLVLLRRTLRSSPQIAYIVHSLKIPTLPPGMAMKEYHSLVGSVIMACPNFERLVGPPSPYDYNFSRLFHALSTRKKLKEMNWVIQSSPFQRQRRLRSGSASALPIDPDYHATPGDLQPEQSLAFLDFNVHWSHLNTLSIHCLPGATLTPLKLILTTLSYMPALQHLCLSYLPGTAFDDSSLISLPPLQTLSLSHLPGITSAGLSTFATRQSSRSIRKLTLRHISLDALPVLVRILSNLISLRTLNVVQAEAPVLPPDEMIWLFPYIASASLRKLHWDITRPNSTPGTADLILAKSIKANGFPSLQSLRVPNDPDGIFQHLCLPNDKIELPTDRYRGQQFNSNSNTQDPKSKDTLKGQGTLGKASTFPRQMAPGQIKQATDLHQARMAAQSRLDAASNIPRYFVNIINEDGHIVEKFGLAGYVGTVESKIRYCLTPDTGAADETGGLVDMACVLADCGENIKDGSGCTGQWNTYAAGDRRDRDRWWHTERGRWRGVSLL